MNIKLYHEDMIMLRRVLEDIIVNVKVDAKERIYEGTTMMTDREYATLKKLYFGVMDEMHAQSDRIIREE